MSDQVKVDFEELKAAVGEIEARSKDMKVAVSVGDRKVTLTATDRNDNLITITLYDDRTLGAQINVTQRLMFLKGEEKKRV